MLAAKKTHSAPNVVPSFPTYMRRPHRHSNVLLLSARSQRCISTGAPLFVFLSFPIHPIHFCFLFSPLPHLSCSPPAVCRRSLSFFCTLSSTSPCRSCIPIQARPGLVFAAALLLFIYTAHFLLTTTKSPSASLAFSSFWPAASTFFQDTICAPPFRHCPSGNY